MHIWSVGEISSAISGTLAKTFSQIAVKGEVSNFSKSGNGHLYFSIKEGSEMISVFCLSFIAKSINIKIENGMDVIVYGKLSCYTDRSQYQIQAQKIKIDGLGKIILMIEERKEKLRIEGLFDQNKKQQLPKFPKNVGLITSFQGAVIHDICSKMNDRFGESLQIYNVAVQGQNCVGDIIAAIDYFENTNVDVILIARGGGSFEDLLPFNDEVLARKIFACKIPIISAVGHESDFTICDLVADFRASTPTHAAFLIFPLKSEILDSIDNVLKKNISLFREKIGIAERFLSQLSGFQNSFSSRIHDAENKIFLIENDLKYQKKLRSLYLENSLNNINSLDSEINAKINIAIDDGMKKISSMWQAICLNMINKVSVKDDKINAFQDSLEAKNPVNIMKKGYAVIKDKNNKIITSRNDVKRNDCIKINFLNDEIIAIVEKNIDY